MRPPNVCSPTLLAFSPTQELSEQFFAVRRIADRLLRNRAVERVAKRGVSFGLSPEPALCRTKPLPPRSRCPQVHLAPLWVRSVAEKFRKAREQRLHVQIQQPKPLAVGRPVVGEKSG